MLIAGTWLSPSKSCSPHIQKQGSRITISNLHIVTAVSVCCELTPLGGSACYSKLGTNRCSYLCVKHRPSTHLWNANPLVMSFRVSQPWVSSGYSWFWPWCGGLCAVAVNDAEIVTSLRRSPSLLRNVDRTPEVTAASWQLVTVGRRSNVFRFQSVCWATMIGFIFPDEDWVASGWLWESQMTAEIGLKLVTHDKRFSLRFRAQSTGINGDHGKFSGLLAC